MFVANSQVFCKIFGVEIYNYGVILAIAVMCGFYVAEKISTKFFKLSKKEDSKKCKVIKPDVKTIVHDGKTTVVILKDDSVGIAHCLPEDTFDESVGEEVAYIKAKINSLQNKLKQY